MIVTNFLRQPEVASVGKKEVNFKSVKLYKFYVFFQRLRLQVQIVLEV